VAAERICALAPNSLAISASQALVLSMLRSRLSAPVKGLQELIWFDRSAHLPNSEERDLFNEVMVAKVLPLARDRN